MTRPPSDPDYWYDPDKPVPVPEGMETTAEERARWKTAVGRAWGMSPENIGKVVRDLDCVLADVARLTAINADLLKVNLSHAEAFARIAAERDKMTAKMERMQGILNTLYQANGELEAERDKWKNMVERMERYDRGY